MTRELAAKLTEGETPPSSQFKESVMSIFSSVEELLSECGKRKTPLWRLVMEYSAHESGIEPQKSWDEMSCRLCAMRDARRLV